MIALTITKVVVECQWNIEEIMINTDVGLELNTCDEIRSIQFKVVLYIFLFGHIYLRVIKCVFLHFNTLYLHEKIHTKTSLNLIYKVCYIILRDV